MTNSKILNMFHLLTGVHEATVEKLPGEPQTLIITLTIKGERETFNSKSVDYRELIRNLARKDFNEPFTEADIKALNLRLEAIATPFRPA